LVAKLQRVVYVLLSNSVTGVKGNSEILRPEVEQVPNSVAQAQSRTRRAVPPAYLFDCFKVCVCQFFTNACSAQFLSNSPSYRTVKAAVVAGIRTRRNGVFKGSGPNNSFFTYNMSYLMTSTLNILRGGACDDVPHHLFRRIRGQKCAHCLFETAVIG
jgi:hypothetical protein